VLRDDGTLWLNLGDSYHGGGYNNQRLNGPEWLEAHGGDRRRSRQADRIRANPDLKPKDLIGIPWRVAFALQAEGWWLRADIIWAKGSCLPESVTDRPTRAHEYVFLLTKAQSYYYDQEAVREPLADCNAQRTTTHYETAERYGADNGGNTGLDSLAARMRTGEHVTRNKRSVWHINPRPFAGAHFAVMPSELAETCIKAGSSEKGCCVTCGAPFQRVTRRPERPLYEKGIQPDMERGLHVEHGMDRTGMSHYRYNQWLQANPTKTVGWVPTCNCPNPSTRPCLVLDPFAGSGTTLAVAKSLDRHYVGVELNPAYIEIAQERLAPAHEAADQRAFIHEIEGSLIPG
jgi:DNA modification methylase